MKAACASRRKKKCGERMRMGRTILLLTILTSRHFHASYSYAFQPSLRIDISQRTHQSSPIYAGRNQHPNPGSKVKIKNKRRSKKDIQTDLKRQYTILRDLRIDEQSGLKHSSHDEAEIFATFESNVLNSIWSSSTVSEVYEVLRQLILSSTALIHQVSKGRPRDVGRTELQWVISGFEMIGPNIAAAALRRIIDVRPDFNLRRGGDEDAKLARSLMPPLVEIVARAIVTNERKNQNKARRNALNHQEIYTFHNLNASLYRVLKTRSFNDQMSHISCANTFHALAKVSVLQKRNGFKSGSSSLRFLVQKMCADIIEKENNEQRSDDAFTKRVNPVLLLETLCSLSTFKMTDEVQMLHLIGDRLKLGDATGKLTGRQLSQGLWAYASLERPHLGVLKSFSRRLRKANVRKDMSCGDIARASWAVGQSMKQLDFITQNEVQGRINASENDIDNIVGLISDVEVASLREESATMVYTLSNALVHDGGLRGLSMGQVADLMTSYVIFEFDSSLPIFSELDQHIQENILMSDGHTTVDIARILWSLQRLRIPVNIELIEKLPQSFARIIETEGAASCAPKTLNTIIRSITLMLPDNGKGLPEIQSAMSMLLSDRDFLSKCNEFECSNFMWSLSMTRNYNKSLLVLLSDRMRDEDILSSCTPSSASRFLWSFTNLVENGSEDLEMKEILFEMFQTLGGILLSTQLTPVDASSAMWAMAKSSYSLDMGIFDHLAEVLAVDFMLENATVQQIAEACWSCGKMFTWEDPLREKMEFGEATIPPYVKNGEKFASYLVLNRDRMSSKDLSQTLWAIGRLQISNDDIVTPLACMAASMAIEKEFNSQELANIIWALSKANFNDKETICTLTKEIRKPAMLDSLTPQEAANVLYALGKMRIKDKNTFSCMNAVIMRQLEMSTTQTIANALWAHECVQFRPPRQLFDSWAKEKLDIVGLYYQEDDPNGIEIIKDRKKEQ